MFWAVIWASLEFFGLVLGLFYEDVGLVFQPASGNADVQIGKTLHKVDNKINLFDNTPF